MSKNNDKYLELSVKLSEETNNRITELSKQSLDTMTEKFIRTENDNALLTEITNIMLISDEKINQIKIELDDIKTKLTNEEQSNFETILKSNEQTLEAIEISIENINSNIVNNIKIINDKILEKHNLKNNLNLDELNYELENLTIENDKLIQELKKIVIDKSIISKFSNDIKISNSLVKISTDNVELESLFNTFAIYKESFINIHKDTLNMVAESEELISKIDQIIPSSIFNDRKDVLINKLKVEKTIVDLELVTTSKLDYTKIRITDKFKELLTDNFETVELVNIYGNDIRVDIMDMTNIIKDIINNTNNLSSTFNGIKLLYSDLCNLYSDIVLENKHKNELTTAITSMKEDFNINKIDETAQITFLKNEIDALKELVKSVKRTVEVPVNVPVNAPVNVPVDAPVDVPVEVPVEVPVIVSNGVIIQQGQLPLLKIKRSSTTSDIKLDETSNNIINNTSIVNEVDAEVLKINNLNLLKYNVNINNITIEECGINGSDITKTVFGKIANVVYSYNGLKIIGQGIKTQFIYNDKLISKNINFESIENINKNVEIMSKSEILKIASLQYDEKYLDILSLDLVYFISSSSDLLIPAYNLSGNSNGIDLINSIIPANLEYLPKIHLSNVIIKSNSIDKYMKELNTQDSDSKITTDINIEETNETFTIQLKDLVSSDHVEIISVFKIINNIENDGTFTILLPNKISSHFYSKLNKISILLVSTNIYGFSFNLKLSIDLSKYSNLFTIINQSDIKSKYGGNIHNYGVEWGENVLGGTTFNRFTKEMEKLNVYKEYAFDAEQSNEIYFNKSTNANTDEYYLDNVDTSIYIGHGSGNGILFETPTNNDTLTYKDTTFSIYVDKSKYIEHGSDNNISFETPINSNILTCKDISLSNGWGSKDLEFKALLSCKVLQETSDGKNWAQRWGPCFNGLHLLCGFQSNANVGEHNLLKFFAQNQYTKSETVRMSWINAANCDQPSGTEVVVMGPLVNSSNINNYNSIPSSINGLYRAYWNDHTWGVSNGPGLDISKNDINGWWRIVFTV